MRIAFASYEYPFETGGGGIGVYLQTAVEWLKGQGHQIVVFTGTKNAQAFWETNEVYRLPANGWKEFNQILATYFVLEHRRLAFDVLECTDYEACGLSVKIALPELPIVVRLHTPLYLVDKLLFQPLSPPQKLRFCLGAFKRMKLPNLPSVPKAIDYTNEFSIIKAAEVVSSPSASITEEMRQLGFAVQGKTMLVPLPFDSAPFQSIEARKEISASPHIVFIGRMETRKGVVELAKAIPAVIQLFPNTQFTFVGGASHSPVKGIDMQTFLQQLLTSHRNSVHFTGRVSRETVMNYLSQGDIFVFPSHYESFGLACCEAMASGKAVIGSRCGGMSEIIEEGVSGLLIKPKSVETIAKAIVLLLHNNELRLRLGRAARERVRDYLSLPAVINKQLACYQQAIEKSKRLICNVSPIPDIT
ncbi:MAG: glycosyltransferase family 1 protein [Chitinophagaceae bacterium]|nr:MAG: glycosyltransferase family 1 protein [Chitinophagaceae bacterium]